MEPGEILIIEVDPDGKSIEKKGKDQTSTNMWRQVHHVCVFVVKGCVRELKTVRQTHGP